MEKSRSKHDPAFKPGLTEAHVKKGSVVGVINGVFMGANGLAPEQIQEIVIEKTAQSKK